MPTTATQAVLDTPAAEFRLPATDGKTYALDDVAGERGTVVVFICNHCPYVKAVIDRMVSDARVLMSEGVGFAAICSNDAASYPDDLFENMKRFAKAHDFPFPYLHDETQTVARAYGAVCTPDFFGYNADRRLKYRGRLDEGRTTPPRAEAPRELVEAMRAIATTGVAPDHDGNGPKRFSVQRKMAIVARTVARRAAGTGGPGDECLDRQADRVARSRVGRRGYRAERT